MHTITITARTHTFTFPIPDPEGAWYDLDGAEAVSDGWTLRINADRDVYACLTAPDGTAHYGIISDGEDEPLADNFGFADGDAFVFYDHPETESAYI